jgi:hypothetical protein
MCDFTVKQIDEMEAIFRGAFKRARAELGVESFGLAIIDLPPDYAYYLEHDHNEDGQEEVFLALAGGGEIEIDGVHVPLDREHMVRVGPKAKRKLWPGPQGARVLVIGGVPGSYEAPAQSRLGEPDPMASD